MAKCIRCNVTIKDDTYICPLCHQILERSPDDACENVYPNIHQKRRKLFFAIRLYVFFAVLAEALLLFINYKAEGKLGWSVITGFAFIYALVTLIIESRKGVGLRNKILFHTIFAVVFIIGIDFALGYRGWSVNFVLPSSILVLDIAIFVLILVNRQYYQEYILLEILTMVISVAPIILNLVGVIVYPELGNIPFIASVILFFGTLVIGGRKSNAELSRRFHIR